MTTDADLVVEQRGAGRWLRLNRPAKRNAMTRAMADRLRHELASTAEDPEVAALVITGTGTEAFSAGADRAEVFDGPTATLTEKRTRPLWPVEELFDYPKPIIAAVNGPAFGGGATLAMATDLRIAVPTATFTFGLAKVGLTPEFGSSYLLWRQVGYSLALELMLTGRQVSADEALQQRLVNQVVPSAAELDTTVRELVVQLASLPHGAAAATKAVLRSGLDTTTFAESRRAELRALASQAAKFGAGGP